MPNFEDEPVDIETNLKEFPNILQQRKKIRHDNPAIGQDEYRKGRGVKGSKARERWQDGRVEQVRGDCMSEVRVHHVFQ